MWERVRSCTLAIVGALLIASSTAAAPRALPSEVEAALERAKLPRDSLVVVVQEVGARTPRLAWQAQRPVNPASLMKLITTDAALDLLGPAWTWTTPVWLRGTVHDGVLDGDLVIKGSGDPTLVLERVWLLLRRVQQLGVREIRGDIVLDRNAFSVPEQSPADFDGEALRPYNVRADALLLNYRSLVFTFTPDPARGVALISTDPLMRRLARRAEGRLQRRDAAALHRQLPRRLRRAALAGRACRSEELQRTHARGPVVRDGRAAARQRA